MAVEAWKIGRARSLTETVLGLSEVDMWAVTGLGLGDSEFSAMAQATAEGFPSLGSISTNGIRCVSRRFAKWLDPKPDGTIGCFLMAQYSTAGGDQVVNSLSSRATLSRNVVTVPLWYASGSGTDWFPSRTTVDRPISYSVYEGILSSITPDDARNELRAYAGQYADLGVPGENYPHILIGGQIIERIGSTTRYQVIFQTISGRQEIAADSIGDNLFVPGLNHLEELVVIPAFDGNPPTYAVRTKSAVYREMPDGAFAWISNLDRIL